MPAPLALRTSVSDIPAVPLTSDVATMSCGCSRVSTAVPSRWFRAGPSGSALTSGNKRLFLRRRHPRGRGIAAVVSPEGRRVENYSPWDEKPFEVLPGGKVSYLDEQDILTLLDPPKELVPLDPASYNPAAYLWKKISDVPEERRHHLLYLLNARLISRLWQVVGTRYNDAKLMKKSASSLLSTEDTQAPSEFWSCRKNLGPLPVAWINDFKKVLFRGKNGVTYGRLFIGHSVFMGITSSICPLYFTVREVNEVMSTEHPCDLAYEFGDGLLYLTDFPEGLPEPAKNPWPFNDQLVIYIRHAGPGVLVGQAWQEGRDLEQVPKKFCGEILMVKEYNAREHSA